MNLMNCTGLNFGKQPNDWDSKSEASHIHLAKFVWRVWRLFGLLGDLIVKTLPFSIGTKSWRNFCKSFNSTSGCISQPNTSQQKWEAFQDKLRVKLDAFLCGNESSIYSGLAVVRFGSYQSQSSVALSTNRKLRSVTVANTTKNRFINRLFYRWYLFHKDSTCGQESTRALQRNTAMPSSCIDARVREHGCLCGWRSQTGFKNTSRGMNARTFASVGRLCVSLTMAGFPSSLLKAQGARAGVCVCMG